MAYQTDNIIIEGARILFRNFSGAPTKVDPRGGKRSINIAIDDVDAAQRLKEIGWNIKQLDPRDEGEDGTYHLPVFITFSPITPDIFVVTKKGKRRLDESTIGELDFHTLKNVDLVIRPYHWEVSGNTGIKAFVKTMYVTLEEDAFADKYADIGNNDYEAGEDIPW